MLDAEQFPSFKKWYSSLRDSEARGLVAARIFQIQVHEEFVGDCRSVGGGVTEMRIHLGPGYRIYGAIRHGRLLLLLQGGSKRRQQADIEKAKRVLRKWDEADGN